MGCRPAYARGAHELAPEVLAPLEPALVRSLEPDELERAFRAVTDALLDEIRQADAELADRLEAPLAALRDLR